MLRVGSGEPNEQVQTSRQRVRAHVEVRRHERPAGDVRCTPSIFALRRKEQGRQVQAGE